MNYHNALAGLCVGLIVGATGMGGASLMAPILIYLFHFKAKYAIGSDLAYAAIAKVFGSWQHKRAGNVNLKLVFQMSLGSIPSSLLGVWALHTIDKRSGGDAERIITHILGAVLILVAVVVLSRSMPRVEAWFTKRRGREVKHGMLWSILVGCVGGFLVGLTSVGAGTLFGVALIFIFGLGAREVIGTDIYHGCLLSAAAALGHVWVGDVDYGLVASLLIGAIPGVLLGGLVSSRLPERALRPTLGTVLLLSGLKIFS